MTGKPPELLIGGIICMIPMMRKYILGSFENCTTRFSGTKSNALYLLVFIELSGVYVSGWLVMIDLLGISL